MADITISDLGSTGIDLLQDAESYLAEVADEDLNLIQGGVVVSPVVPVIKAGVTAALEYVLITILIPTYPTTIPPSSACQSEN